VWDQVVDSDPAAYWHWHESAFDAQSDSGGDWADEETFTGDHRTDGERRALVGGRLPREPRRRRPGEHRRRPRNWSLGWLQGTPGFVLYNREADVAGKMVGAHPYENFANAIEQIRNA